MPLYRISSVMKFNEVGLQESGKAKFPGEKVITDESPEFEDNCNISQAVSMSIQEFRAIDENDHIIETLPS